MRDINTMLKGLKKDLKAALGENWVDYDEDADVLYISFQKPQHADESEMEDNIVYHYRVKDLVGITVIGAKKYGVKDEASSGSGIGLA